MPFNCFKKLYESLVQPIINYGESIWGASEFSCINSVQNKACKFFLGIGKYAPNTAAQGDMGWKMSLHRQWECILRLKLRLVKLPDICINKRIYVWSESMSCKRVSNWNYKVTDMLNTLEMHRFVDPNIHINISTILFQNKCTKFFTWNKVVKIQRKEVLVVINSAHINYLNKDMRQKYMRQTYIIKVIEVPWLNLGVVQHLLC